MPILTSMSRALIVAGLVLTSPISNSAGGPVSLILDEPHNAQDLFQRDAAGGFNVPVTGTTSGTSAVQARAVDADSNAEVVGWTTIDPAPTGGAFSGTLRCPGRINPYLIEVRDASSTGSTAKMLKRFYVGAYGVLWGQSNAVNWPGTPWQYPLGGKGSLWNVAGKNVRVGKILDSYPPSTRGGSYVAGGYPGSPPHETGAALGAGFVYLVNTISERLGCAVSIIHSAVGGQPLSYWATGAGGWTKITADVAAAGGDAEFAILNQGEADADAGLGFAVYKSQLLARQQQFHNLTGRDASTFKYFICATGAVNADGVYVDSIGEIRAAQIDVGNNSPGCYLAASNHVCRTTDGVHVDGESFCPLGAATGCSVGAAYGFGPSGAGPRVVSGSRAGTVVGYTVQHAGGTALLDGAGGNGSALTGFRFFLASDTQKTSPLAIASTSITATNKIRFVLAADPGAPIVGDYGMIPAPHAPDLINTKVAVNFASAVFDNVALINQVRGCPLQPFAAMAITEG